MADFTPTQGRYLAYIQAYIDLCGLPPAETEIAAAIGVSPPSVNRMMKMLEKKGLIRRQPGVPRSTEILVARDAVPKWEGTRLARTTQARTVNRPPWRFASRVSGRGAAVYCFKVTLKETVPPIWRRFETKDVSVEELHELIQTAMGWTNSHLHIFEIAGTLYTHPASMGYDFDNAVDYSDMRVSELVSDYGTKLRMRYEYDFGDGWQHEVVLEKVTEAEPGIRYPRCIDGAQACPPEDVGGAYGFAEYVEAITDPNHSEHDELLEWNGPFDPAKFDTQEVTRRMHRGLPKW